MNYTHIRLDERSVIQRLKNNKASVKQIAFIIGKHPSTVYRKIKRNSIYNYYEAYKTANSAYKRRFIKPKKIIKLGIEKEILKLLEIDCSPEKIHGRLKKEKAITVSTESIYQYIYSKPHLTIHLRNGKKKRKKRINRYHSRIILANNKKSIHKRPKILENKKRIGDWEDDLIAGANHSGYILTLVDRATKFLKAIKIDNKKSNTVNKAIRDGLAEVEDIHTITFDNGTEFYGFNDIEQFLNCKVYFTDTHSPWQRELNEYTNRLIRQYLPKKTYFKNINQKDIDGIQNKINMRPRKVLDYLSPYEVFRDLKV